MRRSTSLRAIAQLGDLGAKCAPNPVVLLKTCARLGRDLLRVAQAQVGQVGHRRALRAHDDALAPTTPELQAALRQAGL